MGVYTMNRLGLFLCVCIGFGTIAATAAQDKAREKPAKASAASIAPVNLNTATLAQLETLPGIGAATAERIVEYRQKNGVSRKSRS